MQTTEHSPESGFAPVARSNARILVLGSMPSRTSLAAQQYYAHPRNAFWPITGEIFGFNPALPYAERLDRLMENGIALWDVAHQCVRPGSMDAHIRDVQTNDFASFFTAHPQIRYIFFNGAKAESLFARMVAPVLPELFATLPRHRLPSTSPAHAALHFEAKLAAWSNIQKIEGIIGPVSAPNN